MAEREIECVVENCINIGKHRFFGHSICGSHIYIHIYKRIPGPLEAYAASRIKAGEDTDTINEARIRKNLHKRGRMQRKKRKCNNPAIEWFYKWKNREEEPVLKRRTNPLFLPEEAIMEKDG